MSKPGAYHRARWMAKLIYALKIFLFRGQFKLTKAVEKNLARFVLFIATLYVPAWYEAPLAARAPALDLAFYRSLVSYEDERKSQGRHRRRLGDISGTSPRSWCRSLCST